jgi:hypothetical protein
MRRETTDEALDIAAPILISEPDVFQKKLSTDGADFTDTRAELKEQKRNFFHISSQAQSSLSFTHTDEMNNYQKLKNVCNHQILFTILES